jgi:catechol-2,3-dioxygenase
LFTLAIQDRRILSLQAPSASARRLIQRQASRNRFNSGVQMPVVAFNHFNLRAERTLLDRLRDFYVEVVGLRVGDRPPFAFHGYWLYLGDQAVVHLVEDATAPAPGDAPTGTFDHVAFTCQDLPAFERHLRSRGVSYRRAVVPGRDQVQLFVKDPAGNGVEFNFARIDG